MSGEYGLEEYTGRPTYIGVFQLPAVFSNIFLPKKLGKLGKLERNYHIFLYTPHQFLGIWEKIGYRGVYA